MVKNGIKFFCLIAAVFSIFSSDGSEVLIRRVGSALEIDGKSSDAAWQNIPWQSNFVMLGERDRKPAVQSRFKAVHDGSTIYFLIQADEPLMSDLHVSRSGRDSDVWNDDCMEIVIDPNRSQDRFYHFAVSANGVIFDEERLQGGLVSSSAWNCRKIAAAVQKMEKSWQLEIAIPMVSLGIERIDGKLAFNIARERYAGKERGAEISSFAPAGRGLLAPVDFAPAQLEGGNITRFAWKFKGPYEGKTVRRNGRIVYSGKVHLANHSGELVRGFLRLTMDNGKSVRKTVIMDSGVASEMTFDIEVDPAKKSTLLHAELSAIGGEEFLYRQIPVNIDYSPLEIKLTNPPYRNMIFSDMKINAIEGVVNVNDESVANTALQIVLRDKNGRVIAETTAGNGRFSLPVPALNYGEYFLTAGNKSYSRKLVIRKLPPKKGEVRFDADHVMYVDGKKFLPYGWFGCRDFERASSYGFNVIIEYAITAFNAEKLNKLFDRLHALNMKAVIYCYPENRMYSRPVQRLPLTKAEADAIRQRIRSIKDHPALLAWYLCDEPDLSPALPARMKEIHDICVEEDPYHPTVILNNTGEGYRKYAQSGDVVMPDIYPNFMRNGNSGVPMITMYDSLRACADAGDRILWCTPQGFNYDDCGHPGQRIPTPAELRNMHYQTLLGGATGFIWYIYEYNYPYPEVFSTLSSLLDESRKMPLFFSPGKRRMLDTGKSGVLAGRYDVDGKRFIVVINTLYQTAEVVLPIPAGNYYAAGEAGVKITSSGKVKTVLKPLEVRIFTTDKGVAESFSVAENEKTAMETRNYLQKKGNLAYGGNTSVDIRISGFARSILPVRHLNDGAYYDGFTVSGKNPEIVLTFPEMVTASKLRLYGIDIAGEDGIVEIMVDGKFVKVADLFKDPSSPKAAGEMSTFSEIPEIRYRKDRDALSAEWKSMSFKTLRISGFRARKIVEVEIYP